MIAYRPLSFHLEGSLIWDRGRLWSFSIPLRMIQITPILISTTVFGSTECYDIRIFNSALGLLVVLVCRVCL